MQHPTAHYLLQQRDAPRASVRGCIPPGQGQHPRRYHSRVSINTFISSNDLTVVVVNSYSSNYCVQPGYLKTITRSSWRDQNCFRFLGIPYAESPVGNLRFAAPVPKTPFTSVFDGIRYKGICPQTAKSNGVVPAILAYLENGAVETEDCLNLNVYTPSLKGPDQALLPVLLYLHGGGFVKYVGARTYNGYEVCTLAYLPISCLTSQFRMFQ